MVLAFRHIILNIPHAVSGITLTYIGD